MRDPSTRLPQAHTNTEYSFLQLESFFGCTVCTNCPSSGTEHEVRVATSKALQSFFHFFFFNHTRSFVKGLLGFSLLHQTCKALSKTIFRDSGLRSLAIFDNLFYNRFLGGKRKRTQQPQCSWKRISLSSSRNTVWKYEPAIYLFSVDKMSHARFQMMLIYVLTAEVIFQSSFKE